MLEKISKFNNTNEFSDLVKLRSGDQEVGPIDNNIIVYHKV